MKKQTSVFGSLLRETKGSLLEGHLTVLVSLTNSGFLSVDHHPPLWLEMDPSLSMVSPCETHQG